MPEDHAPEEYRPEEYRPEEHGPGGLDIPSNVAGEKRLEKDYKGRKKKNLISHLTFIKTLRRRIDRE